MKSVHWLVPALAAVLPFGASAQTSDADYCRALTQKYETYVSNMSVGRSAGSGHHRRQRRHLAVQGRKHGVGHSRS